MTAASAPEEGRKCWLKVWYDGVWRKIEWNTSHCSFLALETKVKEMFRLNDKMKMNYVYVDADGVTNIAMSSDEELTTALHLLTGDFLTVKISLERRKRKGPLMRAYRAAKAHRPLIAQRLASLPATARSLLAPLSSAPILSFVDPLRAACFGAAAQARAGVGRLPRVRVPSRKVLFFSLFFLALSVFFAHHSLHAHHHRGWMPCAHSQNKDRGNYHHFNANNNHVTVLAATYGGLDVTSKLQEYYNKHGTVLADNSVFGDPAPRMHKHLHVVYQHNSPRSGVSEVYSQSFHESSSPQHFTMARENCAQPEESFVKGRHIKVLGALYDDMTVTCAAKRLAATGRFSTTATQWNFDSYKDAVVNRMHFGAQTSRSAGVFTLVYLKDNKLRVFQGKDGSHVTFTD